MPKEGSSRNAIVLDTSVLIHDPDSVNVLLNGGDNTLFIPWLVISELERLQNKPNIGIDASQAITNIQAMRSRSDHADCIRLVKDVEMSKISIFANSDRPEHHALALAHKLASDAQERKDFDKVKIVSRNSVLRLFASDLGADLEIEDYHRHQAADIREKELKVIDVFWENIDQDTLTFAYDPEEHGELVENEGVICISDRPFPNSNEKTTQAHKFAALRKGSLMHIIPRDMNCMGLQPLSNNGEPNWWQYVAMYQLMDPTIELVFLRGGAGSGKTLLALAAGIEQRTKFHQIMIARPMVPLEDEDHMGFLPGNVDEKMAPWLKPIHYNLGIIKSARRENPDNEKIIAGMQEKGKIIFEPLDYIRGITYHRFFVVVDEAQNLTPHQIKTIITRAGNKTKLVITGDLDQIDRQKKLDRRSSGLSYAVERMTGQPMVGVTTFSQIVRSRLAGLGESLL